MAKIKELDLILNTVGLLLIAKLPDFGDLVIQSVFGNSIF